MLRCITYQGRLIMAASDEQYQNKFIHSLFTSSSDDLNDDEEDDEDNHISQHVWHCPEETTSSIIYHLAFLAPGHGDSVWNSSECIAQHLLLPECRTTLFNNVKRRSNAHDINWPPQYCIEFGAGAALPSLVLLKEGANKVVITDRFVNDETFDALRMSVDTNAKVWGISKEKVKDRVAIMPHTWGEDVEKLTRQHTSSNGKEECKADLLIASDCIYNPTYHKSLLDSTSSAMDCNSLFIVGYSLHGNVPSSQILNFFDIAKDEFGLQVVNEFTKEYDGQKGIGCVDKTRGAVYIKLLQKSGYRLMTLR